MSTWLPASPCTPPGCATHQGPARHPAPAVVLLLAGCALTLAGALCAPLALLMGRACRERLTRAWAHGVIRAFGVRMRVTGRPDAHRGGPGVLVVANHVSWLDIPLVAAVCPGRMLAKSDIRTWPLLGPLAALGGTLFVERERLRALPATVHALASALRGGARVVVFPEGSTWCGRGPGGRFRPAAFQAAIDAGASVQPVRIRYLDAAAGRRDPAGAAAFVGDDPLAASLWRVVRAAGLTAEIHVMAPIPAGSVHGRRALARLAQSTVASDRANRPAESVHH
ncbi:lysophospholipid acyltransferase family protein [Streptomyces sp. BE230]|uniref:lysophospholipid acyltransferase family protein n=1 Tax=Streptomyces sp. BE230 TaxID=3002526 RepID=UPI002ED1AC0E|nr:lysophospholipid acyltransferase family protein [Streptomyces sp. BE230]